MKNAGTTIICRVGWCEKCFRLNRPSIEQRFLAFGSRGYHIYYVERHTRMKGFTPHLYELEKKIGGNVVFNYTCGMENCGFVFNDKQDGSTGFYAKESEFKRGILELKDWNSLVMFKRDKDYYV